MCKLVPFSDQTRGDGEIKEGKLCIQWKSKKKKIQSIWKIDSHFTFGVYYEHTDLTLHSETTHLAVSQWTHLFVSELNFWVNSTCCESVNSTFVNQLNLLWANSQLVESAYIRSLSSDTVTIVLQLIHSVSIELAFTLYYNTYSPQSTWSKCKILPDTSCMPYILLPLQIPSTGSLYIIHREA